MANIRKAGGIRQIADGAATIHRISQVLMSAREPPIPDIAHQRCALFGEKSVEVTYREAAPFGDPFGGKIVGQVALDPEFHAGQCSPG